MALRGGSLIASASVGAGDAGSIAVAAQDLSLLDASVITSGTFGQGSGGMVTVHADNLELRGIESPGGGFITSSIDSVTAGQGDAGEVQVRATNVVIGLGKIGSDASPLAIGMGSRCLRPATPGE